jgi:ribonuclease BN (tRNA processing enzyme)
MLIDVIGSSPAWPNPGQAHAGYLLSGGSGGRLLLDCGPGVLGELRRRELLPIDAIVVTHLHLDHWGDLVPWCWFSRGHPGEAGRPELWVPPGAIEALEAFGKAYGREDQFGRAFDMREFAPRTPFEVAGRSVVALPVTHYGVASFGLRVEDGVTLSYSGDSAPCPELGELAVGADMFICEATLADSADDGDPRGHMTADEAIACAGDTRLLLTHRPIELEDITGAERARPGLQIEL